MKIRDPQTGKEFDKPSEAFKRHCVGRACEACPLATATEEDRPCEFTAVDDPEGVLKGMGFEILREKPRLCEILNVGIDEPFTIVGHAGRYRIDAEGVAHHENGLEKSDLLWLIEAINNPDTVARTHLWSDHDRGDAEAIHRVAPLADTVGRDANGMIYIMQEGRTLFYIGPNNFPGVKSGERAEIKEILGGKKC